MGLPRLNGLILGFSTFFVPFLVLLIFFLFLFLLFSVITLARIQITLNFLQQ